MSVTAVSQDRVPKSVGVKADAGHFRLSEQHAYGRRSGVPSSSLLTLILTGNKLWRRPIKREKYSGNWWPHENLLRASKCRLTVKDSLYTATERWLVTVAEQPSVNKNLISACCLSFKLSMFSLERNTYNVVIMTSCTQMSSFFQKSITNTWLFSLSN